MKTEIKKSLGAKAGGNKTFYVNGLPLTGGDDGYFFFNTITEWTSSPQDMDQGSSWGIPGGTLPTDLINVLLQEMAANNPFLLEKIRVRFISATINDLPSGLFVSILKTNTFGQIELQRLDSVRVIDPTDEQSLIYEFPCNEVIDGMTAIGILQAVGSVAEYTSFTATFYVDAIADVYPMNLV